MVAPTKYDDAGDAPPRQVAISGDPGFGEAGVIDRRRSLGGAQG